MDFLGLNRIGIILNFLAGFMLAPELIGLERLRKFEFALQQAFDGGKKRFQLFFQKIKENLGVAGFIAGYVMITTLGGLAILFLIFLFINMWERKSFSFPADVRGFFIQFLQSVWQAEFIDRAQGLVLFLSIALPVLFVIFIIYSLKRFIQEKDFSILMEIPLMMGLLVLGALKFFILFVLANLFAILSPLILLVVALVYIIFKSLLSGLDYLIQRLEGEDRVRGYVVSIGIALYILGNLFQLIATF